MITKRTFAAFAAAALLVATGGIAAAQTYRDGGDWTQSGDGDWTHRDGGDWTHRDGGDWTHRDGGDWTHRDGDHEHSHDYAGSFDRLSPGNQKIARSLFDTQTLDGNPDTEAWSLDRIAATKQSGEGWGQVFKQMKSEGLTDARNLGQVVSGHYQPYAAPARTRSSEIAITTGSNHQEYLDTGRGSNDARGGDKSNASGHGGGHGIRVENAAGGSSGGRGLGAGNGKSGGLRITSASGHGSGMAYGHSRGGHGASASAGITSGAGRSAGIANGAGHSGSGNSGRALGHYK